VQPASAIPSPSRRCPAAGPALRGRPREFRSSAALKPDYAEALSNRATVLKDLFRFDEALQAIDRALEAAPNSVAALCNRGSILQFLDRPKRR